MKIVLSLGLIALFSVTVLLLRRRIAPRLASLYDVAKSFFAVDNAEQGLKEITISVLGRDYRIDRNDLLVVGIAVALHLVYAAFVRAPIIHGDEAGYLMNAAALTGYRGAAYSSYYAGYSILLIPSFLASSKPWIIYGLVRLTNALLWGAVAFWSRRTYLTLAGETNASTGSRSVAVALVTSCYPAFLVFSSLAFSENAFIACVALCAWLLVRLVVVRRVGYLVALLATAAFSILVHPKGAAVFIAAVIAAPMVKGVRMSRWTYWVLLVPLTFGCTIALHLALRSFLQSALGAGDVGLHGHYPSVVGLIVETVTSIDPSYIYRLAVEASGQFLYLCSATLGLFWIGLLWGLRSAYKAAFSFHRPFAAFAITAFMLTFGLSVIMMASGTRADHAIYGRYNEGVVILLMLPAFLRLNSWRTIISGIIVGSALTVFLALARGFVVPGAIVLTNIAGVGGLVQALHGVYPIQLFLLLALGLLGIGVLRRRVGQCYALISFMFLAQAALATALYLAPGSAFRARQHHLTTYIKQTFPDVTCVNYDEGATGFWEKFNYQFYLIPDTVNAVTAPFSNLCSNLIISARGNIPHFFPHATRLQSERSSNEVLWITSSAALTNHGIVGALVAKNTRLSSTEHADKFRQMLGSGWYAPESWGVWSKGNSYIFLRLARGNSGDKITLTLKFRIFAASVESPRQLIITAGHSQVINKKITSGRTQTISFEANEPVASGGTRPLLIIEIRSDPVKSPRDLGISGDSRPLGVGLQAVSVDYRK